MAALIAPCGFRCDRCLAFRDTARKHADRVRGSGEWARYFHLQVPPQRMRCNGCVAGEDAGAGFPDPKCEIRKCALARGMETCASCADNPCAALQDRLSWCDKVVEPFRALLPPREFDACIAPYDCRGHLEEIRKRGGK